MASSNRHWPSMFKSKPHHNQWQQHDHHKTLFSSGCEERSNEPKPRWNPKPEQIRILEAIFNSGMVNPPRDEIRRIRAQLQEYGQVGDANVFYWFQNRKSRSKQKQHRNSKTHTHTPTTAAPPPPSSSSSSSDRSTQMSSTNKTAAPFSINIMTHDATLNSPTASVNRPNFHNNTTPGELLPEPFFFPVLTGGNNHAAGAFTQGFGFSEISSNQNQVGGNIDQTARNYSNNNILLTDLMMNAGAMNNYKKVEDDKNKSLQQQLLSYSATPATLSFNTSLSTYSTTLSSPAVNHIQGAGKSTVIINEEGYEIPSGPLNVREAFGDEAVLINSSGQPVETNEWGFTLQPLQQGAFYYLV